MLISKLKATYQEYPRRFWAVVAISFIDRIGGTMLFPFFALYITQKFQVGMTQAGFVLGLFSIFGLIGNTIGGALTDKYGRRNLILFGLVFSALSTLSLGLVNDFGLLIPVAAFIGLLSDVAGPAHGAMIADILPEKQRQEGYGILRVVANMSWIIGPTIGGFVAGRSYFALFVMDAVISCFVALLFFKFVPETRARMTAEKQSQSGLLETFKGYRLVLRNLSFVAFIAATILMSLVYQQMYNSLSVFLRDVHGIQPQGYGFLLTASAVVVILFQFSITRRMRHRPPFLVMALGTLFYMLGFGMFGFVGAYWLFVLAVVIITIGEMIIMPTSQALAANFAPEEMRGRYMAVYAMTYSIPATIAPGAAGLIMDNFNPNLVWIIGAGLCAVSALAFYLLHQKIGMRERFRRFSVPVEH
jgi:MFS family permease